MKSDFLPPMTMIVSPDLYQQLTETPEKALERREQVMAQFANMAVLMKRAASRAVKPCQQPQAHPARCGCEEQS
ncbi:hypothetical protein [Pseudomonas sp. O230]|uniref:hypothetical protein n=1 Tax=Pseudomonas sp. O230 TaxID=3159450 RepID=UPI00387A942A